MIPTTAMFAAALALAHVLAAALPKLTERHRRRWISLAGGVAVAYVFIYILPELVRYEEIVRSSTPVTIAGKHVFLLALIGLCIFYGVERLALVFRRPAGDAAQDRLNRRIFWVHIPSFAIYNALVGYLLVHEFDEMLGRTLFTGAIGLHFLVNDYALEKHHMEDYRRLGRWILAGAVLAGWCIALVWELPHATIGALFSLLAGGIIFNIIKEELPEERRGRFWYFLGGAAASTALLLMLG